MAALVIFISSDPKVILFGYIPIEVPVVSADLSAAPKVGAVAVASHVGVASMVSPFLCLDNSESNTELPERHVSSAPHDAMIPTAPILPTPPTIVAPSSDIISPIDAPPKWAMFIIANHSLAGHSTSDQTLSGHTSPVNIIADSSSLSRFLGILLLSSVGPSRKRCTSPATTVPLAIPASGALVPTRADLLPPHKRFKDSYLSEDSIEEDIDANVLAAIETNVRVDVSICMEVSVEIVSEDKEEYEAESSARGTVKIEMDRVIEPVVADEIAEHTSEDYPDLRLLEAESLIASAERAGLLDRVATMERSNMRLRDTLRMESVRVDRLRRRMGYMEDELRQICVTPKAIEEIIAQRVAEALTAYKANHAVGLVIESQSQNGDDGYKGNDGGNRDRNGGGNVKGNRGGNGNGNSNRNDRGAMSVTHECTYPDFIKCQPLHFKGTEGVIGLTRWFEKIEKVFHISNFPDKYQVKYAT
ncbi:hypothetical protein Tco_0630172 [Tanacetum coccineum]